MDVIIKCERCSHRAIMHQVYIMTQEEHVMQYGGIRISRISIRETTKRGRDRSRPLVSPQLTTRNGYALAVASASSAALAAAAAAFSAFRACSEFCPSSSASFSVVNDSIV